LDWIASIIPQQWRIPWRAPSNGSWNNLGWVFYSRKQSFMIHMQHLLPVYIICNWYPAMKNAARSHIGLQGSIVVIVVCCSFLSLFFSHDSVGFWDSDIYILCICRRCCTASRHHNFCDWSPIPLQCERQGTWVSEMVQNAAIFSEPTAMTEGNGPIQYLSCRTFVM
jgi:hypothetical protein